MHASTPLSLYIHIPFCQKKCPYCDFNTYAGLEDLFQPLVGALLGEIEAAGRAQGRPPVSTLFLGGGTPTVLPGEALQALLNACREAFAVLPDAEITSEANPGTVDMSRFQGLRQAGVNRLSLGVQSFNQQELRFLGRIHSAEEAERAFHLAREAGFTNINLDLMFGLPGQSPESWQATLQQALSLEPEHLSLYALTVEEGTPFANWAAAGRFPYPDPDHAADLYELADELLLAAGYVQYEISNWARALTGSGEPQGIPDMPRYACRHNLTYWRNQSYLGFGPGAHSAEPGRRWANVLSVRHYIERAGLAMVDWSEEISEELARGETMMLGLRLVREGVGLESFKQRHGETLSEVFGLEISELSQAGLIEELSDRVRLTRQGRLLGNQAFSRFL